MSNVEDLSLYRFERLRQRAAELYLNLREESGGIYALYDPPATVPEVRGTLVEVENTIEFYEHRHPVSSDVPILR